MIYCALLLISSLFIFGSNADVCVSDNAHRHVLARSATLSSFCGKYRSVPVTKTIYTTVFTLTAADGAATITTATPIRRIWFDVLHSNNFGLPVTPITYSGMAPSHVPTASSASPTDLATYPWWQVYSACTCVFTPTSTVYAYTASTVFQSASQTVAEYYQFDVPDTTTYSSPCEPSVFTALGGYGSISINRPAATISPVPSVSTRMECCQICMNTFNCLWWRHETSGQCQYSWATDIQPLQSIHDVCPNGQNDSLTYYFGGASYQGDFWGPGPCILPQAAWNSAESSPQAQFDDYPYPPSKDYNGKTGILNCRTFGGAYCKDPAFSS